MPDRTVVEQAERVKEMMADAIEFFGSDWFFDFKVPALFRAIADFYDLTTDEHDEQMRLEARAAIRARAGSNGEDVYPFDVHEGDDIQWAGRRVRVVGVDRQSRAHKSRPGVYLTVEAEGVSRRRCHYYDTEIVKCWRAEGSHD